MKYYVNVCFDSLKDVTGANDVANLYWVEDIPLPKSLVVPYEKEPLESLICVVEERPKVLHDVVNAFRNAENGTNVEGARSIRHPGAAQRGPHEARPSGTSGSPTRTQTEMNMARTRTMPTMLVNEGTGGARPLRGTLSSSASDPMMGQAVDGTHMEVNGMAHYPAVPMLPVVGTIMEARPMMGTSMNPVSHPTWARPMMGTLVRESKNDIMRMQAALAASEMASEMPGEKPSEMASK